MKVGSVLKNHMFKVTNKSPSFLAIKQFDGAEDNLNPKEREMKKASASRPNILETGKFLESIEPPGLYSIKQVEMYKKWQKFMST